MRYWGCNVQRPCKDYSLSIKLNSWNYEFTRSPLWRILVYWVIIGSGNGLSPVQCQAINWTNVGLWSIGLLGTNCNKIGIGNNPITRAPTDCGPRWNTIRILDIQQTLQTSVDNITKYGSSLFEIGGTPVAFSDEIFRGTHFSSIVLRDVSWLPQFHSSKLTLCHLELGGIALGCIDEIWLNGLDKLRFSNWPTHRYTYCLVLYALTTRIKISRYAVISIPCTLWRFIIVLWYESPT